MSDSFVVNGEKFFSLEQYRGVMSKRKPICGYYLLTHRTNLIERGDYTTIRAIQLVESVPLPKVGNGFRWIPCLKSDIEKFDPVRLEAGVKYYGYL